ncbi:alpha/beta hydrolase [Peribacillus sp. NPDC097295]|uniref:alpha/beta hydrolase n=1 Tax=Peribacillus sp. NPDC097295 TaxID=3364402 RepID=UPI00382BA15D
MKHFVEVLGKGNETAVFLPGTGWAGDFGMPIAESLVEKFNIHLLDLPGIGRSEGLDGVVKMSDAAKWLNDYLEEKQIDKITIIGHSLGGGIGLSFAYFYPEKVNKLILLDIGFAKIERFPVQMFGSVGYFLPGISILHRILGQKFLVEEKEQNTDKISKQKTEEEINTLIKNLELVDTEFVRKAIENQQETTLRGISLLLALYRCNMPRMLSQVKVPCLVLYGNRYNKPLKLQNKIHRQVNRIRKSNIIIKELNGGHYAHLTDIRAISYIKSFLQ